MQTNSLMARMIGAKGSWCGSRFASLVAGLLLAVALVMPVLAGVSALAAPATNKDRAFVEYKLYDAMNAVMTFGQERRWRRVVAGAVGAAPGLRVLDLAAGTGASSTPFTDAGAMTVACDFSPGMLAEGRRRHPQLTFVTGDALRLPFQDGAFDAVTISFGLRNVAGVDAALAELADAIRRAGWAEVAWRDLMFGAVALHTARRPEAG